MSESVRALREICQMAHQQGVSKAQLTDLVGKVKAMLGSDYATTRTGVGGPIYELATAIKIIDKGYGIHDPDGVGDSYYDKAGTNRVRQLKWATGSGRGVLNSNLSSALAQLSGTVQGNPEAAPANSIAIADIVLTNPPQRIKDTFSTEQGMREYLGQMVSNALGQANSTLDQTSQVSVRITMLQGDQSTKYCVDFTRDNITVRAPETKSRDCIMLAEGMIELFANDVGHSDRQSVADQVGALHGEMPSW